MDKKHFIKHLEKITGNPTIGFNVLTGRGNGENTSEFWVLDKKSLTLVDNKANLSLCTLRLKKALPARLQAKQKTPAVDNIECDVDSVFDKFQSRYDIKKEDIENETIENLETMFLGVINQDLEDVLRLRDDLLRLFNNNKLDMIYGDKFNKKEGV